MLQFPQIVFHLAFDLDQTNHMAYIMRCGFPKNMCLHDYQAWSHFTETRTVCVWTVDCIRNRRKWLKTGKIFSQFIFFLVKHFRLSTQKLKVETKAMIDINNFQETADLNNHCIIVSNSKTNVDVYDSRHHASKLDRINLRQNYSK